MRWPPGLVQNRWAMECPRCHQPDVGEAFTMLTMPPGPDIEPYHDRQIAILDRADWANWLDPSVSAKQILKALPAGSLNVTLVG